MHAALTSQLPSWRRDERPSELVVVLSPPLKDGLFENLSEVDESEKFTKVKSGEKHEGIFTGPCLPRK